jgi:hypothetical protein
MLGRTMALTVSRRPLTTEARIHPRFSHVGFVVNEVALEHDFCPSSSVFSCQCNSAVAVHANISSG